LGSANGKADCRQVVAQTESQRYKREERESCTGIRRISLPLVGEGMMDFLKFSNSLVLNISIITTI